MKRDIIYVFFLIVNLAGFWITLILKDYQVATIFLINFWGTLIYEKISDK